MNATTLAAQDINREHALARNCAQSAVQHAIRCGELLQAQKVFLGHGAFMSWVTANCEFKYSTATRYMKAASQNATGVVISTLSKLFPSGGNNQQLSSAAAQASGPIPMESGMVTFGVIDGKPAMVLFESKLNPGFWHDLDLRHSTASVRPCRPDGLRARLITDVTLSVACWGTSPDSGDWLKGESDYWKESQWRQRA